jgi:hypothetical protein
VWDERLAVFGKGPRFLEELHKGFSAFFRGDQTFHFDIVVEVYNFSKEVSVFGVPRTLLEHVLNRLRLLADFASGGDESVLHVSAEESVIVVCIVSMTGDCLDIARKDFAFDVNIFEDLRGFQGFFSGEPSRSGVFGIEVRPLPNRDAQFVCFLVSERWTM